MISNPICHFKPFIMEIEQKELDVVSTGNEENTTNTETDTFGTEEQTVSISVYLYTYTTF